MSSPYGLNILDNFTTCPDREQHPFRNLSPSTVHRLNDITTAAVYPRAASRFFADFKKRDSSKRRVPVVVVIKKFVVEGMVRA
jgi:hypothetical protein